MTSRILNRLLFCSMVIMLSCIDDYEPENYSYENMMVVDGSISNAQGPYFVRLSLSSRPSDPRFIAVEGASVKILDNQGSTFLLEEKEPGVYQTDPSLTGIAGMAYKLAIVTASGVSYDTDFEELKVPVAIDTVFHEVETHQEANYDYDIYGYGFYVNTELANEEEGYFKWDLEATYQYQSEYTIRWYFDGELHWFHGPDSLYNCWKTEKINSIYVSATNGLSEPAVIGFPLNFVSTETRELSVRYSLLVKQLTISKSAYDFWSEIRKQNGGDWSLYSTQPHFIRGNVYRQDNPDEPVLGYFMVNGVKEFRIFVDRPPPEIPMRYSTCQLSDADFEAYGQMGMMDPVFYPIYAIETPGGVRATPNQNCVDCRRKGGTIEKPEFWIDKNEE